MSRAGASGTVSLIAIDPSVRRIFARTPASPFAAVIAGYLVELLFGVLRLTAGARHAKVGDTGITWTYTSWLKILFLVLHLLVREVRHSSR